MESSSTGYRSLDLSPPWAGIRKLLRTLPQGSSLPEARAHVGAFLHASKVRVDVIDYIAQIGVTERIDEGATTAMGGILLGSLVLNECLSGSGIHGSPGCPAGKCDMAYSSHPEVRLSCRDETNVHPSLWGDWMDQVEACLKATQTIHLCVEPACS